MMKVPLLHKRRWYDQLAAPEVLARLRTILGTVDDTALVDKSRIHRDSWYRYCFPHIQHVYAVYEAEAYSRGILLETLV